MCKLPFKVFVTNHHIFLFWSSFWDLTKPAVGVSASVAVVPCHNPVARAKPYEGGHGAQCGAGPRWEGLYLQGWTLLQVGHNYFHQVIQLWFPNSSCISTNSGTNHWDVNLSCHSNILRGEGWGLGNQWDVLLCHLFCVRVYWSIVYKISSFSRVWPNYTVFCVTPKRNVVHMVLVFLQ